MIVDRRVFVAGATLAAFAPAFRLPPSEAAVPESGVIQQTAFVISGWRVEADGSAGDEVWMRVGHGWVTAWR